MVYIVTMALMLSICWQYTDMPEEVRLEAVDAITSAMEKYCMVEQTTGPSRSYDVSVS